MQMKAAYVRYDQPHQFEPLLPRGRFDELLVQADRVVAQSRALGASVKPGTADALRELMRSMNSYYSNHIEGDSAHPVDIERALQHKYSDRPEIARQQRLALAHIEAEVSLEREASDGAVALSSAFLRLSHAGIYDRLSLRDRTTPEGRVVEPGVLRKCDVMVGRHHPPAWGSLHAFLARADATYAGTWGHDSLLCVAAAAHQRMAWTHPFLDGNGRACRLQTHFALLPVSLGLWSVSRGLALQRHRYFELLANADMPRHGDLDGRGNLSERMLHEWCRFFVEVCEAEVSFMTQMLDVSELSQRVARLVVARSEDPAYADYCREAIHPLQYMLVEGRVPRRGFADMSGLTDQAANKLVAQLLTDGLLQSDEPTGELRIGFPLGAIGTLFPTLYPEAVSRSFDR